MIDIEQLSKEERYDIPDGYFEHLTDNIMDMIHKEKRKRRNIWMTSIAAVCLAVLSTTLFFTTRQDKAKENGVLVETPLPDNSIDEQLIEYYTAEITEIDYYNF